MLEEMKFMGEIGKRPKPEIKIDPSKFFKPELIYIRIIPPCYYDILTEDNLRKYIPTLKKQLPNKEK